MKRIALILIGTLTAFEMAHSNTGDNNLNLVARKALAATTETITALDESTTPLVLWHKNGHITRSSKGTTVTLLPSLGREASDFNELIESLTAENYSTISIEILENPKLEIPDFTLQNFSLAAVNGHSSSAQESTVLIGHALGNRIARSAAHQNPENVKAVILLAAGGQVPMEPRAEQSLRDIFNPMKSHKSRMEDVRYAFFADGNDSPDHWTRGWHTKTAIAQGKAVTASADDDSWHCAGGVPMLIIQPMQDRIAPIENAYALRDKCPQEVEIVEVENAGHAFLPEQPEAVAEAVLAFLAKHHPVE